MNDNVIEVGELIIERGTPEGVPDSADYYSPDDDPPDDSVVIPGPKGGQYAVAIDEFPDTVEVTDAVAQFMSDSGVELTIPDEPDAVAAAEAEEILNEARDDPGKLIEEYGTEESLEIIDALADWTTAIRNASVGGGNESQDNEDDTDESDDNTGDVDSADDGQTDTATIVDDINIDQIEVGDTVTIDVPADDDHHPPTKFEAEVEFIDDEWVEVNENGNSVNFPVEYINEHETESPMPDEEFIDRYDGSAGDVLTAAWNLERNRGYDDYSPDIRDRAEEMSPTDHFGEGDVELVIDAAEEVLLEEEGREALELLSDEFDDVLRPNTLVEGEVDDVPVEERLEKCFDFAEEIESLRDRGIDGGNTKGDEMEVLEYADGTVDYATPTDAYYGVYNDTGVVEGPGEAKQNNINSPKVIDALGGSTCEVELTEDPSGEEYLVKEGIEGNTVGKLVEDGEAPFDDPETHDSAIETLSAAFFTGNADLHRENVVVDENGELVVIDHDSAGPNEMDEWMHPADIATGLHGIDTSELTFRIYEKAAEIVRGETELPEDMDERHREYVEQAANRALEVAQRDPSANVSQSLVDDDDVDNVVGDIAELEEGERVVFYDEILNEEIEGDVEFIQLDEDEENWVAFIWDDDGHEYSIHDPTKIEEVI